MFTRSKQIFTPNLVKLLLSPKEKPLNLNVLRNISLTGVCPTKKARWAAPMLRELKRRHEKMTEKGQVPENRRSKYIEWNHEAELYALSRRLGETFDNKLLQRAVIDQSHVLHQALLQEQLGLDKVLKSDSHYKKQMSERLSEESNKILAEEGHELVQKYCNIFVRRCWPHVPAEGLRSIVAYLCADSTMSKVGQGFGLKDILYAEPYPPSEEIMADGARAVIAALHRSSGPERTETFIIDFVATHMAGKSLWDMWEVAEPFFTLEEIVERSDAGPLDARLVNSSGINTLEAVYRVALYCGEDKTFIGAGYGETIDIAKSQASLDALARMFGATAARPAIPFNLSLPPSFSKFTHPNQDTPPGPPKQLNGYTIKDSSNIIEC